MPLVGEGRKNVLIVSEKDWHNEHWMMRRLINRSGGLDHSHFKFASLYTPSLLEEVRSNNIKAVVAMGEPVLRKLTGEQDILRWRGRVVDWMGTPLIPTFAPHKLLPENPNAAQIAAMKAQGITMLVNPPRFQGVWMLDVSFAQQVAAEGFERKKAHYIIDPSPAEFATWAEGYFAALRRDPETLLSWDVETVYKAKKKNEDEYEESESDVSDLEEGSLLRISFSHQEYSGVSVPWEPAYLGTVQALLGSVGPKVVWNGITFDVPVVEKVGFEVNGEIHDGMDAWHVYQSDLPKGLEFVSSFTSDLLPWKHLNNENPGLYSAIDADSALRNFNWIKAKLQSTNQWELYYNLYHRVMVPLTAANKRGNFIDIQKRDELRTEMTALIESLDKEMQPLVPREVKPRKVWLNPPVEGWKKLGFEKEDPILHVFEYGELVRDFDVISVPEEVPVCTNCGKIVTNKAEHFTGKRIPKLDAEGNPVLDKKTGKPKGTLVKNECKVAGGVLEKRPGFRFEYHEVEDFNPGSADQMKAYARFFKHPIGVDARDSSKETMDKNHVKELIQKYGDKHPLYEKAAQRAKLAKTLGTYIYDPDENGLIHQTYKNAPSTPRLSGANKNLMNVGKREDNYWAVRAREQIIARPGHRFIQADSSAIEALIQGWDMGDPQYMELATQSIHAFVVAKKNGFEWTGSIEQVDFLKKNFKDDYNKMKTANYLTNFGGGPYLMWMTDRKSFPTKAAAEDAQNELFRFLPKLKPYHYAKRARAQKEGYLVIPGWNFRHYYYDVFTTDQRTGKVKLGKDAKRVVALAPQGSAALFLRENTLLIAYGDEAAEWLGIEPLGLTRSYMDWMPANFAVHDGYTLEVPDGSEWEAADVLERVLTRPIKHLSGLRVGCEIDISPVGGNWGAFDEVKNSNGLKTVKTVRVPIVLPPGLQEAA